MTAENPSETAQDAAPAPRPKKRDVHGWVVLDKPIGMTSTQAVAVIKRLFNAKRAGHAGSGRVYGPDLMLSLFEAGEATGTLIAGDIVYDGELVTDTFQHRSTIGCLEASVRHVFFPVQADELKDSPSAKSVMERHEAWKSDLPTDDDALWDWITLLDETSRAALLAHCVSYGVNALYEKADRYGGGAVSAHGIQQRIAQADRLARAVGLDMVEAGWTPTVGNYLGRVTKPRILEAVREAKGEQASQLIDHLRKGDMAKEAERLLADIGWLPEPLRLADLDGNAGAGSDAGADGEGEALPQFLTGDDDEAEIEDSEPHLVAAE